MKRAADRQRKSNTRKAVNKRLLRYSIAAGATVAMADPAQAAVVQSGPKNITINADDCYYFDLNNDALDDFGVCLSSFGSGGYYGVLEGRDNNSIMSYPKYTLWASRLCSEVVSGDAVWYDNYGYTHITYNGYSYGAFPGESGSIGVRFLIPGDPETTHYGYIRISVDEDGKRAVIKDWAYESTPNTPITTPPCGEEEEVIPTLNQWGIIILMGLILVEGGRRLKRRKDQEA